ncbi:MAG: hypothetical protein M3Z92_14655, partial [Bacteroidota bacterium]|nr:hypothetical protein [Bacteroidota bacterium]
MKLYKHLWLLLFLSNVYSTSAGQDTLQPQKKKCSLRILNYETGLLNNTTTFVLTDAQGFTWISTKIGLQRFNGNKLETVLPVINNATQNINHPVYLFNLHNGFMWISYNNQVIEYNPFRNTFRRIITTETSRRDGFDMVPLKETAEGVWCMQREKGICIYSKEGKIIKTFSFYKVEDIDTLFSSDDMLYKNIIAVNDDYIFIASARNEVLKINT